MFLNNEWNKSSRHLSRLLTLIHSRSANGSSNFGIPSKDTVLCLSPRHNLLKGCSGCSEGWKEAGVPISMEGLMEGRAQVRKSRGKSRTTYRIHSLSPLSDPQGENSAMSRHPMTSGRYLHGHVNKDVYRKTACAHDSTRRVPKFL